MKAPRVVPVTPTGAHVEVQGWLLLLHLEEVIDLTLHERQVVGVQAHQQALDVRLIFDRLK